MKLCLTPVTINYIMVTACNRLGIGKHYAVKILILILISFVKTLAIFARRVQEGLLKKGELYGWGRFQ